MNFRVNPNNLLINLMNSGFGDLLLRSKVNIQEQGVIEQIMKNVDELSNKLSKEILDIQN